VPKVKAKNLAELIQTQVSPTKILKLLKRRADKGDRFALELLATHLAGAPPRTPPAPAPPAAGAANLKNLTDDQLGQLEALLREAEGDVGAVARYEAQRELNRRMFPGKESNDPEANQQEREIVN
jgi:hypothetical protein